MDFDCLNQIDGDGILSENKQVQFNTVEVPMIQRFINITSLFLFLLFVAASASDPKKKVENFTLEDYNGVKHSLSEYKDSKAIVLMFIATQCPVSNS